MDRNFLQLNLKGEYRSRRDDFIKDFYLPILERSVLYQRATGFFSSTALSALSEGICALICNGGKIRLITSPKLSSEDIDAIDDGLIRCGTVTIDQVLSELRNPRGKNFLSSLIASGCLEIKIALLDETGGSGMFHEKSGLMSDDAGNVIAFAGSMNESANAFITNYEAIDVFASWTADRDRVRLKQAAFDAMWSDREPGLKIKNFSDARNELVKKTGVRTAMISIQPIIDEPSIPKNIELRPYQRDAIEAWARKNYRGIFDMATGTGKTYTALAALVDLYNAVNKNLAVIIVCPYQHLVEQWKVDVAAFGMKPLACYSASTQHNWKDRLHTDVMSFNLGVKKFFCMVTTNATFATDYIQTLIKKLRGNIVLVVDEAHNFGAERLSTTLVEHIPYRIALSATIDRHGDPEGTQKLYNYFGGKCIEYTLKNAIDGGMLTPYCYYPITVSLDGGELNQYLALTQKIVKSGRKVGTMSDYVRMLLIKRARIVAGANEKISKLREVIQDYRNDNRMLIYCGATTMRDVDYREDKPPVEEARQIDIVADMLGNELKMRVTKFTSEEPADERERIKENFSEGTHLQALVAIRCLDEGVNIPSIKTAFILASSTNPKEYIQRRGRVLRTFPGKKRAVIFDFVTLPIPLEQLDQFDEDTVKSVKSLAKKEMLRIKDFAEIAENPFASDALIGDIQAAYDVDFDLEDDEYV